MSPLIVLLFVVIAIALFVMGYAFRGAIRREMALVKPEALALADRIENAARGDAKELQQELISVVTYLRAKL
jgi:hypothetical protein